MFRNPFLLLLFLLLLCRQANAQPAAVLPEQAITPDTAALLYRTSIGGYKNLYAGIEYIGSYPGTTGHPFFEWDTLQQGVVYYNGIRYPDVGVKYDLVSEQLLLLGKQNLFIALIPQKIDFFSIKNHLFVHVKPDSTTQRLPDAGFYEVLYGGPTTVLAKRKKKIERSSRVEDPFIFKQFNTYFVKSSGVYYPVESEKDLLELFGSEAESLKKQLRENGLRFKKDREQSIIKAVAYYDQLKN